MVIFGLGILALIATAFTSTMRSHVQGAANIVSNAKAEALADAGVQLAIKKLIGLRRAPPPAGNVWPTAAFIACVMQGAGILDIDIEDEAGKIDLNYADERLLAMALRGLGASPEDAARYVDRIVDFRDSDHLRRPNGAEGQEYNDAQMAYGPKNALFETQEELEQVLGLPEDLRLKLIPLVTVHSRREGIDPSRASQELIIAIASQSGLNVAPFATSGSASWTKRELLLAIPQEFIAPSSFRSFRILAEGVSVQGSRFIRVTTVEFDTEIPEKYALRAWHRADASDRSKRPFIADQSKIPYSPCG